MTTRLVEIAEDVNPDHCLHTIRDEAGRKLVEKLLKMYVREEEVVHARFPAFLIACDRLVCAHGGAPVEDTTNDPPPEDDEDYADDEDTSAASQLRGGKSSSVDEDVPDDADDFDTSDASEESAADHDAEGIRIAVRHMLRRHG